MRENTRLPVVFLPHGGGPWPFVEMGLNRTDVETLTAYLRSVANIARPKALLVISAHWEESVPTLMTGEHPPLLFDYSGFPPESYQLTWPAPGDPALAQRVQSLLNDAGVPTATNAKRGFDHGTFVPLKVTFPEANLPTVQLSLKKGLNPSEHLAMGRALAPLREEGVLIIGSGMTFHNLRAFGDPRAFGVSEAFDNWLKETVDLGPLERDQRLVKWAEAPAARLAHPREEHLLPLMVVAGAAGLDRATRPYSGNFMGVKLSAFQFG
ncbi:MAG: DODA-type extradiol aromatic ring-opening family dioxygenase [Myxococcaceae bacterium]